MNLPAVPTTEDEVGRGPSEIDWLVGSLRRRIWLVVLFTLAGTVAALWIGTRSTPVYTAQAQLLLAPSQPEVTGLQITVSKPDSDAAQLETAAQVIRSRLQIERVIRELDLVNDPEFRRPPPRSGEGGSWGWLWPLIGTRASSASGKVGEGSSAPVRLEAPEPGDVPSRVAMDEAVDRFSRQLSVMQQGRALVLGVAFTSESPERAAKIANRMAELYLEGQVEARRAGADRATNWLAERLTILRAELERSEAVAQDYRARHGLADQRKTDITDQQLAETSRTLTEAEADLAARTARLDFIRALRARGEPLDTLPEVLASQVIIDLRRQEAELARAEADAMESFGPRHPQMLRLARERQELAGKIAREVGRIVANLENEVQVVGGRIQALGARIETLSGRSTADAQAALRLKALEREAAANRQLYEDFLARYKNAREQRDLVAPVAEIISVAAPPVSPSSLGLKLFGALGLVTSATLGGLLAICLERFDHSLRGEAEVQAALGLARLALVPAVPRRPWNPRPHAFCIERPLAAYTEALRSILVGLRFAAGRDGGRAQVVLITSSVPAEGKTTLASSLAVYAGHAGHRVLLIDLDLRHPGIARTLNGRNGPGMVEVLTGESTVQDAIIHDPKARIDYLAAGELAGDPMPLLAGGKVDRLLARLRDDYDHIVIDTAPVLAATDAQLLAAKVDKVVFVARWGVTPREVARSAVTRLRVAGADLAGAVLTQVDIRRHIRYRFGDVGRSYRDYRRYYVG